MSTTLAQAPLPAGALEKYSGKWIAVRNGNVVAAADSYEKLKANKKVREEDATYHVPSSSALFY